MKKPWKRADDVEQALRRELESERLEPVDATGGMPFAGASVAQGGMAAVGVPRFGGDWDLVSSGEAPGLIGADVLGFVTDENGDIYMDSALPDGDVTPLAEEVEKQLRPPYRVQGTRQQGDLWSLAAGEIKIGRFETGGDELELTVRDGERELMVDGRKSFGSVPELERLGATAGDDYFVRASRIEDGLWEVSVNPL